MEWPVLGRMDRVSLLKKFIDSLKIIKTLTVTLTCQRICGMMYVG